MPEIILSIDQGTTGTTVFLLDHELNIRAQGYREFEQVYPQPGWVEHRPEAIWGSVLEAMRAAATATAMAAEIIIFMPLIMIGEMCRLAVVDPIITINVNVEPDYLPRRHRG